MKKLRKVEICFFPPVYRAWDSASLLARDKHFQASGLAALNCKGYSNERSPAFQTTHPTSKGSSQFLALNFLFTASSTLPGPNMGE